MARLFYNITAITSENALDCLNVLIYGTNVKKDDNIAIYSNALHRICNSFYHLLKNS